MSYSYQVTERRRRTTNTAGYGSSGNRSAFGYWIPLAFTVTAATIGLVAWVWSERRDDEEDTSEGEQVAGGAAAAANYTNMSGAIPPMSGPGGYQGPPGGYQGPPGGPIPGPPGGYQGPPGSMPGPPLQGGFRGDFQESREEYTSKSTIVEKQEDTGLVAKMSSALGMGRAASPSGSYDWASKQISAGVAAAGAVVGGALSSLRDTGTGGYEDHERWSEEAEQKVNGTEIKQGIKRQGTADEFFSGKIEIPKQFSPAGKKRKTVAIVVSAVESEESSDTDVGHHASILAHLPEFINAGTTRAFVLIYAPDLKTHPLSAVAVRRQSQSMASSFSNISHGDAHTPAQTPGEYPGSGEEGILAQIDPNPIDDSSSLYKTLHNQSQAIVERDTMILPFTSRNGHRNLLKSLSPEMVYIQESLCGRDGEIVSDLSGWVRQTVVVIGDEGGHGGLVDTDDESAGKTEELWWQKEERTGLGKRVAVVESLKIGDDWMRRVNERE